MQNLSKNDMNQNHNKTMRVLLILSVLLFALQIVSCSDDKSDSSTNIKSANEGENGDASEVSEFRVFDEATPPPRHHQHSQKKHQSRSRHQTLLRVVDQEQEAIPPTPWNSRDPIVEGDEMVVEDVRGPPNKEDDGTSTKKNADNRPNIILIMTDDQDVELGSMEYMPETLKIFRDNGVEFRHGYVATPMCCPSRSSILTGLYVHNHNTFTNNDNCSSIMWREKYEKKTFGAHLWSSGYYTSYIGKYLNKYDGSHIPFGWNEWNGLLMNSRFYNYTVNVNGKKFRHGNDYENDYYPDVIANETLEFLTRVGNDETRRPFLLVSSFPSPHGPEDSAPQYSEMFLNVTTHHTPSYNFAPNSDKQWILRQTNSMTPILKEFTNLLMAKRLQTLQSVDVAVKAIMDKLKESGLDKTTYVFYTSDHGYHVGQFGLVKGKSMPYEFDIRVPFFVHGPPTEVKKGIQILEPVMNIDLAPTFLDLAGINVPDEMDGRSIVPLLKRYGPKPTDSGVPFVWKDVFLIESSGRRDSHLPSTPPSNTVTPQPLKKSRKFRDEKRRTLQADNETIRINTLCQLHPHPCLPGQKKYCRKERDQNEQKIQLRKCRQSDFVEDPFMISPQVYDPLYQLISTNNGNNSTTLESESSGYPSKRCRCRYKRSDLDQELEEFDWDKERKIIDEEIELLKKRIDALRQRRRSMRRKWLVDNNLTTDPSTTESENGTTSKPVQNARRGKGHNIVHKDKTGGQSNKIVTTTSTQPPTTTTLITTTTVTESEEEDDEEDEDEDLDDDDEEDDENDTNEEDDEEDDEDEPITTPTTTILPTTTPTTTTSTTTTPTTTTKNSQVFGKVNTNFTPSHNKSNRGTFQQRTRPMMGPNNKKRKHELGLDFEGDFELDSFVRHKHRNRNRHRNRHRPKVHNNGQLEPRSNINEGDTNKEVIDGQGGETQICDCNNDPRWIRQREREDRKRKKLLSKFRKKQKYMKRIEDPLILKQAETCGAEEKMNCFWHDSDHWKTAPFWTSGSFCFCMNSNNNTYSCLRSVNATHNYLYCQFVTGFKMYFDLRQDPFQLYNTIGSLPAAQEDWMLVQLIRLKKCKGRAECWGEIDVNEQAIQSSIWEQIFGRWPRKKKRGHRRKQINVD